MSECVFICVCGVGGKGLSDVKGQGSAHALIAGLFPCFPSSLSVYYSSQ